MNEWKPIATAPKDGTPVLYYFARRRWKKPDGSPAVMEPYRDHAERCEIGFRCYGMWCETGTGHDLFESWRDECDDFPTHWMPLPEPPEDKPE